MRPGSGWSRSLFRQCCCWLPTPQVASVPTQLATPLRAHRRYGQFKRITGLFTGALTGKGYAGAPRGGCCLSGWTLRVGDLEVLVGSVPRRHWSLLAYYVQAGLWRQRDPARSNGIRRGEVRVRTERRLFATDCEIAAHRLACPNQLRLVRQVVRLLRCLPAGCPTQGQFLRLASPTARRCSLRSARWQMPRTASAASAASSAAAGAWAAGEGRACGCLPLHRRGMQPAWPPPFLAAVQPTNVRPGPASCSARSNVATYCALALVESGAVVLAMSDSHGTVGGGGPASQGC